MGGEEGFFVVWVAEGKIGSFPIRFSSPASRERVIIIYAMFVLMFSSLVEEGR